MRTQQQQQNEKMKTEKPATLPIILAVMAFLNARAFFGCEDLAKRRTERKVQLLEAISLINLIEERDDLVQLFQQLQVFLLHQKGDYLQTIKFLEHLCEDRSNDTLKLLLAESYLGVRLQGSSQEVASQVES